MITEATFTFNARIVVTVWPEEVPAMITLYCPGGAVLDADNVSTLFPVVGLVPKDAVTPAGNSEVKARETLPVNPVWGITVTLSVTEDPGFTVKKAGARLRVKLGAGLTLTQTVPESPWPPEKPAIPQKLRAPVGAELLAVSVSTLFPVVGFGANDAVVPSGPAKFRLTLPVNPFKGVTVMVSVTEPPWVTVSNGDEVSTVNVGVGVALIVWGILMPVSSHEVEPQIDEVDGPSGAELLAVIVSTLLPVVGFGLNDAVTPAGSWGALNFTAPLKLPKGITEMVAVVELPRERV